MSFSELPKEVKFIILKMLSVGSRYNASLVWKELADEAWRLIPTFEEFCEMRTDMDSHHQNRKNIENKHLKIFNMDDLEMAGVLASAGHLDFLRILDLTDDVDLTNIPFNIVNSLFKVVRNELTIDSAAGFCFAMLDNINCKLICLIDRDEVTKLSVENRLQKEVNIKCERLLLSHSRIQYNSTQTTSVSCDEVDLFMVSGNVCCLVKMIILGSKSLRSLRISGMDVSKIPTTLLNSLFKIVSGSLYINGAGASSSMLDNVNCEELYLKHIEIPVQFSKEISVRGRVILENLSGNVVDLLDSITCDCLEFRNRLLRISGESDVARSLTKMLESRVRAIILCSPENLQENFSILDNYDGHGRCERLQVKDFDKFMFNDEDLGRFDNFGFFLYKWAYSNGCIVTLFRRVK